jgi:LppP/LprE lipoprotein
MRGEYHRVMRAFPPRPALLACLSTFGVALAACGSSTKTVSVANTPSQTATPGSTTQTASQPRTSSTQTTPTPTTTRSAPEPAFTESEHRSEGLSAAAAVLRAKGFAPVHDSDYHPKQALQVLVGARGGSGGGHGQQAFFFVNGRYIGTDTSQPSAAVSVVSQADTEVTLAYPLYRNSDALCCPGGGHARVRFQLNNGKLVPLDPIPPLHSTTGTSRR